MIRAKKLEIREYLIIEPPSSTQLLILPISDSQRCPVEKG
jgi:hypothetical protein